MNTLKTAACAFILLSLGAAAPGCEPAGQGAAPAPTATQDQARVKLASLQKIVAQTAQTYKQMDTPTLLKRLAEQSAAQKEPFNSLAYRELKGRTDIDANVLAGQVKQTPNGDGLLPLLLLRHANNKAYLALPAQTRAAVLTDALEKSKTFNSWGLPHLYLEDASKAMLETGQSAQPALRRMLSDTRAAPVFGGQEYMEYLRYNYRLCDYALFFLERMGGKADFKMPVAVADRDALIKAIGR